MRQAARVGRCTWLGHSSSPGRRLGECIMCCNVICNENKKGEIKKTLQKESRRIRR